jgi:uncharacterized membrane protein
MRKKIIGYFLQGLFYIAPIGVTAFIIYKIIIFFDSLFLDVTHYYFPGIGLVIIIVGITFLGFLASTFLAKPAIQFFNAIIMHMPVIRDLYLPLKDFFAAFVGKERKFSKPVLVKIKTQSDIQKIGFITQEDLNEMGISKAYVSVYFPHSYAFSGELFVVPIENIKPLNIPPAVAMKFILSGGAIKAINEND